MSALLISNLILSKWLVLSVLWFSHLQNGSIINSTELKRSNEWNMTVWSLLDPGIRVCHNPKYHSYRPDRGPINAHNHVIFPPISVFSGLVYLFLYFGGRRENHKIFWESNGRYYHCLSHSHYHHKHNQTTCHLNGPLERLVIKPSILSLCTLFKIRLFPKDGLKKNFF